VSHLVALIPCSVNVGLYVTFTTVMCAICCANGCLFVHSSFIALFRVRSSPPQTANFVTAPCFPNHSQGAKIPGGATLVFEVELLGINNSDKGKEF
jgi:hypothetical protein